MDKDFREILSSHKNYIYSVLSFVILGLAVYWRSFYAPWYLDDYSAIVDNPLVRSYEGLLDRGISPRIFAHLTFFLNYKLSGYQPFSYHFVNFAIHLASAWLTLLLAKRVFHGKYSLAYLAGLIFLLHPLQTQAVTYTVQRMTSLSGMFFLFSIYMFVLYKELDKKGKGACQKIIFYACALLSATLCMYTKEIGVTLPLAVFLFDYFFMARKEGYFSLKNILPLALFLVPAIAVIFQTLFADNVSLGTAGGAVFFVEDADGAILATRTPDGLQSRYLATQFIVLLTYLKMFFIPLNQNLDYGYILVDKFFNAKSILCLMVIVCFLASALKYRNQFPMYAFAIFWFFLTLAAESSFVPLDPLNEHRMYIPGLGLIFFVVDAFYRLCNKKYVWPLLTCWIVFLAIMTYQRNNLWASPVEFWQYSIEQAPHNFRNYINLGKEHVRANNLVGAQQSFTTALALRPDSRRAANNLASVYAEQGRYEQAIKYFKLALKFEPNDLRAMTNLANLYEREKNYKKAEELSRQVLAQVPNHTDSRIILALSLYKNGNKKEAYNEFSRTVGYDPESSYAWFRIGTIAIELQDYQSANKALSQLKKMGSKYALKLAELNRQSD
jgi:tetratricopeptide (TPR) repeat protein